MADPIPGITQNTPNPQTNTPAPAATATAPAMAPPPPTQELPLPAGAVPEPPPPPNPVEEAGRLGGPLGAAAIGALQGAHQGTQEAQGPQEMSLPAGAIPEQQPNPADQGGVLERSLAGVGQSLQNNIVNPVKAIFAPPQDHKESLALQFGGVEGLEAYRAARMVAGSVENIIKAPKENFMQATQDFARAAQEMRNGDYRNAASSVGSTAADVMGIVPGAEAMVGPRIRELTEGAREGGNLATPLAKDVTDLATLAAAEKAPEIAQKVAAPGKAVKDFVVGRLTPEEAATIPAQGKFQPATNLTPQDVMTHAEQEGIDLTPGQALKTKPRQAMQGLGERAFVGGSKLEDQIQQNRQALTQSVSDFADRHDPTALGTSEETAGDALQKSTQAAKEAAHEAATSNYEALPDSLKSAPVDVADIRQKWGKIKKDEQMAIQNLPPAIGNRLQEVLNLGTKIGPPKPPPPPMEEGILEGNVNPQPPPAVEDIPPKISFKDAQKLRSAFREMGDTVGADLPARYQGMFKQLTNDVDSAMEKTADDVGQLSTWRQANQGWKEFATSFGERQSPLYRILNQSDPAKITRDVLNRGSAADIDLLENKGVDLAPLRRQVITDIANAGYRVGREGLAGYSDSFLNSLFGPVAKKELYLKAELGRRLGFEVNPSGTSNVLAAEMQIPTSKEGLIRGVGGSAGFAKLSKPRPAGEYLPRTNAGSSIPKLTPAAAAAVAHSANIEPGVSPTPPARDPELEYHHEYDVNSPR